MAENLFRRVNSNEVIENYGTTSIETYGNTSVEDLSAAYPDVVVSSSPVVTTELGLPVTTNFINVTAIAAQTHLVIPVGTNTIDITAIAAQTHLVIPVGTNTIDITAIAVQAHLVIPAGINTIDITAIAVQTHLVIPAGTNTIDVTATTARVQLDIPAGTNAAEFIANAPRIHLVVPVGANNIAEPSVGILSAPAITVSIVYPLTTTSSLEVIASAVEVFRQVTILGVVNTITLLPAVTTEHRVIPVATNNFNLATSAIRVSQTQPLSTSAVCVLTAYPVDVFTAVTQSAGPATVTLNAATATVNTIYRVTVAPNSIETINPTVQVQLRIPAGINTLVLTAPDVGISLRIPIPSNQISVNAIAPRLIIAIPVTRNDISITNPDVFVLLRIPVATANITVSSGVVELSLRVPVATASISLVANSPLIHRTVILDSVMIQVSAPTTTSRQTQKTGTNAIILENAATQTSRRQYLAPNILTCTNYTVQIWKTNHDVVSGNISVTAPIAYVLPTLPKEKASKLREWRVEIRKDVWLVPALPDYTPARIFVEWVVPRHQTTWYVPSRKQNRG